MVSTQHRISILILVIFIALPLLAADPVSLVQYPLMNRPIIVEQGSSFIMECSVSQSQTQWNVQIELPQYNLSYTPSVTALSYDSQRQIRKLRITVSGSQYIELYDLIVNGDRVENAVKVIDEYCDDYTFIHLPDCHLPSVAWKLDYVDNNTVSELRQVINEINLLNPEFVLQTGDIVNNGENISEFELAQDMIGLSEVPMFVTGGNHDLWYNAHNHWHQYFGETMDYDFLYGDTRYIALEMYDEPSKTYTASQMSWLVDRLNTSLDNNELSRIIFTHFDESSQLTGDFVDDYDVQGILYGHLHQNIEERWGSNSIPKLCTSFTMNENGNYRLVTVEDGEITDYPVIDFKKLWVNTYPDNDGTSGKVTKVIHNENNEDYQNLLVKITVDNTKGPFTVTGGTAQQVIEHSSNKRTYYIETDVDANDTQTVEVVGSVSNEPPQISSFSPIYDLDVYAGIPQTFQFDVTDADNNVTYQWYRDGQAISGATSATYEFQARITFSGHTVIKAVAGSGNHTTSKTWYVYVNKSTSKPIVSLSSTRNFALADEPYTIQWYETANTGIGRLYMVHASGGTSLYINEPKSDPNQITFTPDNYDMDLGLYFCKVCVNGVCSQEFAMVIESSQKPELIAPVGNITSFAPVFQWERVEGVPNYVLLLMDQKLEINEVDDEFELENATPIWGMLTSATSVAYGAMDSSGYFNSAAPPLQAELEYSWVVLNCYGNTPELVSTNVVPDIQTFYIDLDPPNLAKPQLVSPSNEANIDDGTIRFKWRKVSGAKRYHFYPFKIESDENLGEVTLPLWDEVITTTDTIFDYQASELLVSGGYKWKVAAVDADGQEVPSVIWEFDYDAPSALLDIRTVSKINNQTQALGRVNITLKAIQGVEQTWPLSTDTEGARDDIVFTPGIYQFFATKDGYAPFDTTLTLEANTHPVVEFLLKQDPSKIIGEAYQIQSSDTLILPNANIRVQHSLEPEIYREALSDQNGRFNISVIPGPYQISATKNGYANSDTLSVSVDADTILTISEDVFLIKYKNKVYGTILNASGNPIYGATVKTKKGEINYQTTTNANGYFSFQISDGTWEFQASKSGFITSEKRYVSVSNGTIKELTPSLVLQNAEALITGSVNDGLQTINDAKVRAIPLSGSATDQYSDDYGNFTLSLSPGYYQLVAVKSGYSSAEPIEMNVESGQTVSGVEIPLRANASLVSGLVTSDGVVPISGAKVTVNGEYTLTNVSGYYKIDVPAGTYNAQASKEGYLSEDPKSISVSVGQNVEGVNFVLSPNASVIKGRVYYQGSGVIDATVTAQNGNTISTETDEDGYFILSTEAGVNTISAWKEGFTQVDSVLTIGEAQTLEDINFYLQRNVAYISGTVYDITQGQEPLSNAQIEVLNSEKSTSTNASGEFQLQITPSNTGYSLKATKSGYSSQTLTTGSLPASTSKSLTFEVREFSTFMQGYVYDNLGNRLESALIHIVGGTDSTYSSDEGEYLLGLSTTGQLQFSVSKTGYLDSTFTLTVSQGDQIDKNLEIERNFKHLSGDIYNQVSATPVSNASLSLTGLTNVAGFSYAATTNSEGKYNFDAGENATIIPGQYQLEITKTGFQEKDTTITIVNDNTNLDVPLIKFIGELHGVILDGSDNPIDSVSIVATHIATDQRYTKISDDAGSFNITSIDQGNYKIQLSRVGYTFGDPVTRAAADDTTYQFTLFKNVGRFQGLVTNAVTNDPIYGVNVVVKDSYGNQGKGTSDASGVYKITSLPIRSSYKMTLAKWGYHDKVVSDTTAYTTTGNITNVALDPVVGIINGAVKLDTVTGDRMADVLVKLQNDTLYATYTNSSGLYEFDNLEAGDYYLSVEKPGYIASPSSQKLSINQNNELINSEDFILKEAVVKRIEISAQPSLVGSQGATFAFTALSPDRKQVPIVGEWSISLPNAIADSTVTESGFHIVFDSTFVGDVWIFIEDTVSNFKDSVKVKVTEIIGPTDGAIQFKDFKGAEFHFPANAVANPVTFGVDHKTVPNIKANGRINGDLYQVQGEIYDLNLNPPSEKLVVGKQVELRLPITGITNGVLTIGRWNEKTLKWNAVGGNDNGNGQIFVLLDSLSQYAVLEKALPLGIREYTAMPNPFSPNSKPINIEFDVSSDKSDRVLVSIDIYNIVGDKVKTLLDEQTYLAGEHVMIPWSGYTDHLRLAKNGRYLIHIKIDDGVSRKELLKPIVLIK